MAPSVESGSSTKSSSSPASPLAAPGRPTAFLFLRYVRYGLQSAASLSQNMRVGKRFDGGGELVAAELCHGG